MLSFPSAGKNNYIHQVLSAKKEIIKFFPDRTQINRVPLRSNGLEGFLGKMGKVASVKI